MRILFFTFILLLGNNLLFGQSSKVEVDNGIFVKFPSYPEYSINTQGAMSYTVLTENTLCIAIVLRNMIPNYAEFAAAERNWNETQKKEFRRILLDNVVKGKFDYIGNGDVEELKIGNYYGRKVSYSAINPATGKRGKRFSVILSVKDKIISFDCMYLKEGKAALNEKESFINSISTY